MYSALSDAPQKVTPQELEKDLARLPQWRREKALAYRFHSDRVLCTESYLMLTGLLKLHYGIEGCPEFEYGPGGKPFLKDYPSIHFNLSHCRDGILCVVDDNPVGCDIECIADKLDDSLCRACLNDEEYLSVRSSSDPCAEFIRYWTIKESLLKYSGRGLTDSLPSLLADAGFDCGTDGICTARCGTDTINLRSVIQREKGFVWTVAGKQL
ncbi:MAG: 4'-phosphopantetheinyl transferase superfamily protein [Bacteroidales bacterium]|nr:4'-phosphopantetheinyl transferase superfamily protein [Candidatus Cacconaster merdequi]